MPVRIAPLFLMTSALFAQETPRIEGALNFRDLGGITTQDGRTIKRGVVFRSGELSRLTEADFKTLNAAHIAYIFDLRTDAERKTAPTAWRGATPEILPISVGFDAQADPAAGFREYFAQGVDAEHAAAAMRAITAKIAVDGAPQIGTVLKALAAGKEPAIIHCSAGKDRTGVLSALLLLILGASRETIYDDYMRSNDSADAEMARMKASGGGMVSALPADVVKVLSGVDGSYLEAAQAAIVGKYSSLEAYVSEGLKLTPQDIDALRSRLLEPVK